MSGRFFSTAAQVKLDATGAGQVSISPPSVDWTVSLTSVNVSSHTLEPTFTLYLNGVSPTAFLEGSYSGSQDSSDTEHRVMAGQSLIGVWNGGDAGAVATLRVTGQAYPQGQMG